MIYFLDTNICIYFLKGLHKNINKKLQTCHPDTIKIPSIVKAELMLGALKSNQKVKNIEIVRNFLIPFSISAFGDAEVDIYTEIRGNLEKRGKIIGPNDLIIASSVLQWNGILVTNNEKEFKEVPHLKIENWAKETT